MDYTYSKEMRLNKLFYLLPFFYILSCSDSEIIGFNESQKLNGKPIDEIEIFSRGNVHLCVADTFLVIQKNEESIFQVYSTNSHKLLAEFGKTGRGPTEFLGPSLLKQVSYDDANKSPVVHVYDYKRRRFNSINILEIIGGAELKAHEKLPGSGYLPYFFYKDDKFMVASPESNSRFLIHDYSLSRTSVVPFVPEFEFNIPKDDLPIVYKSSAYVHRGRGLMVTAPLFLGELDFFDLEGNLLRTIALSDRTEFTEEISKGSESYSDIMYSIRDLDATDDFIYGLNLNNPVSRFYSNRKNGIKVQVFDWEGNPVEEYLLDNRLVTSFAFDSVHNRIYAYSPEQEDHTIISYEIK